MSDDNDSDIPFYAKNFISQKTNQGGIYGAFERTFFEKQFRNDMKKLNVLPPFIGIRASEYITETIQFIKKIERNGYAYQVNSSIYFDTLQFNEKHTFPKLQSKDEGILESEKSRDVKKNEYDFLIWKQADPHTQAWQSPWGIGRPESHTHCSAMASAILGKNSFSR
jgi:cysteinyl-tRNA synthetase